MSQRCAATVLLLLVGALAVAAPASAARDTPQATVAAFLAALRAKDLNAVCATFDAQLRRESERWCEPGLRPRLNAVSARVTRVLQRGDRARVELATRVTRVDGTTLGRDRLVLQRTDRWRLVGAGALLPYPEPGPREGALDPRPAGASAAIRRLVDDELIALSGGSVSLCSVLVAGAPLRRAACDLDGLPPDRSDDEGDAPQRLTLERLEISTSGRAAVAHVTVRAERLIRRGSRRTVVTERFADVAAATRRAGRWWLRKPSLAFYRTLALPPPTDVLDPATPAATWPAPGPAVTAVPAGAACTEPRSLHLDQSDCPFATILVVAATGPGTALVGWTQERGRDLRSSLRPVVAGVPAGPAVTTGGLRPGERAQWPLGGVLVDLVGVDGGALGVAFGARLGDYDVVAVDAAGRPRGPVRRLGGEAGDGAPRLVAAADGGAELLLLPDHGHTARWIHLAADGAPGAPVALSGAVAGDDALAVGVTGLPDGGVAVVEGGARVTVRTFDRTGRRTATVRSPQRPLGPSAPPAVAARPDGTLLVAWRTRDAARREQLLAWAVDPRAPTPGAVHDLGVPGRALPTDGFAEDVVATPGGWRVGTIEVGERGLGGGVDVWTLDAAGAPLGTPTRVADDAALRFGPTVALTADTVAWMADTPPFGPVQIRAAALP